MWVMGALFVVGYTNQVISPEVLHKNTKSSQIDSPDVPWGGDVKDNHKIPDIYQRAGKSLKLNFITQGGLYIVINCFMSWKINC